MILAVDRVCGEVRAGESCRNPLSLGSPRRLLAAPHRPQPLPRTSSSMPEGGPELEDIVRGTDERPFPPDLAHPAQQNLAEASPLLDLPQDRLYDGLAPSIQTPTGFGPEGAPHTVRHRQARRRATAWRGGHGLSMELAIRWDERGTAQRGEGRDVRLAEIAGIQARGSGNLLRIDQHLRQQWLGLLLVIRLIRDVDGNNDLGRGIHGGRTVIPLHETPLGPGDRHDAALGIGEVPLGLRVGHRAGKLRRPSSARPCGRARVEHRLLQPPVSG
jgi:hypothetical protein